MFKKILLSWISQITLRSIGAEGQGYRQRSQYISWELTPNGKFNTLNLLRQNLLFENKYNPDSKSDSRNESTKIK